MVLAGSLIGVAFPGSTAQAATVSGVEISFLQKLNAGRAGQGRSPLVLHAGLRTAARNWSANMGANNNLTHGNTASRINSAAPDPAEANGAPDDGFAGWCENIAFNQVPGSASDSEVAQMFYNQWFSSTQGHKECMLSLSPRNFGQNVAGIGIFRDTADNRWWATLKVAKDNTPPQSWLRNEQGSATVAYSGEWLSYDTPNASGGSYRRSWVTGSTSTYSFTGRGVRWIGIKTPTAGIAEVRLDGVLVANVDQYSSTTLWQQVLFTRTGLASGSHTLQIRVSGTKNASSASITTYVDAFDRLK
jgi:hypothetical protein